jgi:hypothetical protein
MSEIEKMKILTETRCPVCNTKQRIWVEVDDYGNIHEQLIHCDIEEGGCDSAFVVRGRSRIELATAKLLFS